VPIGSYVVDFISSRAKLIVELDGSQHYSEKMVIKDSRRTFFLQQEGYKVLRFNNVEILKNPEGVAEAILRHIQEGL
jgi:very-short-patch-repair endonuclease